MNQTKFVLSEKELPKQYYNIVADMPNIPPPPLHPGTLEPAGPEDLSPLFPMSLIMQEVSNDPYIDIPDELREAYLLYRPTPLFRARRLERALDTPAKIYYKYEGVSPTGSHKPNTALAQAYYNAQEGVKRLTTETGAGQWGSSLAFGCSKFGMECKVYMVRISYDQKPYRKHMMRAYGAQVVASPSVDTEAGRNSLSEEPDTPGSLGLSISEAVEDAAGREDTKYSLGSVLNHVLLHQTVIGLEALKQMEMTGDYPDTVVGCVGGGSNYAGLAFPFLRDKINGKEIDFLATEPSACPTLTKGEYRYDFGDKIGMTPLMPMFTLGHDFTPAPIHAGGLRYHGDAPLICQLVKDELIAAKSYDQKSVFEAGITFAKAEGIIPAPEANHAVKGAIDKAMEAKEAGEERTILFGLCGHGHFDMAAYEAYFEGRLDDAPLTEDTLRKNLENLPVISV